jgi:integrase
MPEGTIFEQRDKALFAFLVLTGVRVGAAASLRLKHINSRPVPHEYKRSLNRTGVSLPFAAFTPGKPGKI